MVSLARHIVVLAFLFLALAVEKEKRVKSKRRSRPIVNPYQDWENIVSKSEITWAEFLGMSLQPPRYKLYIKPSTLNTLVQCSPTSTTVDSSGNSSAKFCNDLWGDTFVTSWRQRQVKDLCEASANSKIHCYDSLGKSRYCIFENAMMNFKKVRRRKQDGALTRSWERGFLSADCGEMAKDDIGYLPLYKPDIEGQDEAICDYVFNETVIAYSHENIRNFGQMVTDYMNVWTTLWLSGVSQQSKDISFLNIDAVKKGKYFGDQPNQFFKNYEVSFRRILKAADFAELGAKVCFKKLIMPPRPVLHFQWEGAAAQSSSGTSAEDSKCNRHSPSSLFQRFNLQIRNHYGLLAAEDAVTALPTNNQIRILLIVRSVIASSAAAGNVGDEQAPAVAAPAAAVSPHITARLFTNAGDIITSLHALVSYFNSRGNLAPIELITQDFSLLPFEEQVRLISSASLVVGMHGAGIASTMHMAVGSKYCCGVIEIFPDGGSRSAGYGYMARRMGHHYQRLDLPAAATTSFGSEVPTQELRGAVEEVLERIAKRGSCFLPAVINAPYL